jgi:hypothetical protein
MVAIAYGPPSKVQQPPIAIYKFKDGKLSELTTPSIPGWKEGDALMSVAFYPNADILGLIYSEHPQLQLLKLSISGNETGFSQWGNTVGLDKAPYMVRFTADGKYAICNSLYVGNDVLKKGFGSPRGSVASIRLNIGNGIDSAVANQLVSRAETGVGPEGMSLSPDGKWIVTTNLERSTPSFGSPEQCFYSSLTLIRFNAITGLLQKIGDFPFNGVLPETALFDNSSKFLAVTSYQHYDGDQGGSIDLWRLTSDPFDAERVVLVKSDYAIPIKRGIHSMVIVR